MSSPQSSWHDARVVRVRPAAERTQEITLQFPTEYVVRPGDHIKVAIPAPVDDVRSYSAVRGAETRSPSPVLRPQTPGAALSSCWPARGRHRACDRPSNNFRSMLAHALRTRSRWHQHHRYPRHGRGPPPTGRLRAPLRSALPEAAAFGKNWNPHTANIHFYWASEGDFLDVDALISAVKPGTELYMCGPIRLMERSAAVGTSTAASRRRCALRLLETPAGSRPNPLSPYPAVRRERHGRPRPVAPRCRPGRRRAHRQRLRRGECGLCQVKVLDSSAAIDHRASFSRRSKVRQPQDAAVSPAWQHSSLTTPYHPHSHHRNSLIGAS